ncbi:MAG: hypothetical protein IPL84_08115 [Chitinophagaceae bacterium]|nr:hypothetical protein [Chitinophagaceae bacterium]
MNKVIKIVLINAAVAIVFGLLVSLSEGSNPYTNFMTWFGLGCLGIAVLDLFVALILFLTGKQNYEAGRGFLLSSGILLLVGFAICSGATLNFH